MKPVAITTEMHACSYCNEQSFIKQLEHLLILQQMWMFSL